MQSLYQEEEEIKPVSIPAVFNLEKLKTKIENMGKHHHIEILKIMK